MKKRITFSLSEEMIKQLKEISDKTLIPQAKLVEKALANIIAEYNKE